MEVLNYIENKRMILLSPYSSADELRIDKKYLFRLRCVDSNQGNIIVKVVRDLGMEAMAILYLNVTWSQKILSNFVSEYKKMNGNIIGIISYNPNDIYNKNYSVLNNLNKIIKDNKFIYGKNIGIYHIGLLETIDVVSQIINYDELKNVYWFGSDAIPSKLISPLFTEIGTPTAFKYIKYFCPSMSPSYNEKYNEVNDMFKKITGTSLDFVQSARYDACWLIALSIMNSDSKETSDIRKEILNRATQYQGLTGNCYFNEYQDRDKANYDIIFFACEDDNITQKKCGYYSATNDKIQWYYDLFYK